MPLETLEDPSARLKDRDLISDKPGRYQTMHSAKGSYEPATSPHQVTLDHFTKQVANRLKKALDLHQYQQLIICAPPHVGGVLLSQLDKQVAKTLLVNIKKDFVESTTEVLSDYLRSHWFDITHPSQEDSP